MDVTKDEYYGISVGDNVVVYDDLKTKVDSIEIYNKELKQVLYYFKDEKGNDASELNTQDLQTVVKDTNEKEHKVESFKDLCDLVNEDNVVNLAHDLALWLVHYHSTMMAIREANPEFSKGKKNSELAVGSFVWVDDGKREIPSVRIKKESDE